MEDKYGIETRIKTVNICDDCTDIYGVPNGASGKIIGYGDSEDYFYHVEFDKAYHGSTWTRKLYLSKNEVEKP